MQRNQLHQLALRFHRFCQEQHVFTLLLAILIGVLSGYGALFLHHLMKGVQTLFYGHGGDILGFVHLLSPWRLLLVPAAGGLLVGVLVHFGASEAKGRGAPEVMTALALKAGRIRKRVALAKILASALCIGSGGSTGREGPMVQIGASIGSAVGQLARAPLLRQKTLAGCGAAAGIISFRDIRGLLDEECLRTLVIAKDVATGDLATLFPSDTLFSVLRRFGRWGVSQLPVADPGAGRLLGALREKDLLTAYDKAVVRRELGVL